MTDLRQLVERKLLPFVERPMRYTGGELNIVVKDLFAVRLHGVLCFPDLYDIGMSHLGLQILYHIVNRNPAWALSRCFHPWTDAEEIMRRHGLPLYSLEYFSPLADADWIGFSVQYELHYTNLVNMLDMAGIPVYGKDRRENDPIVIAGGPVMGNPEPLAGFVDACVIGDGEEVVVSICQTLEQCKEAGTPRGETLRALAGIPGVYVPSLYPARKKGVFLVPDTGGMEPVRAAKVPELKNEWYPDKPLVPLINVVHHRLAVEVMRGCARGCRFCSAGTYYRPVRERDPASVVREIGRGIENTGWRDVTLMSLSTADYSGLEPLLDGSLDLKRRCRAAFSLPSTRIDALTPQQFDRLSKVSPVTSLTIAPEAGSERLRRIINKNFSDEAIYETVKTLLAGGVQTVKLYFMIGLPDEKQEDIDAIVAMVMKIAGLARAASHRRAVNVSVSPFSPKPHTPFQWEGMEPVESLERKGAYIKNGLRHLKNVKVSYRRVQMTVLETVLARGDRAIGACIYNAWKRGARFDSWDDKLDFGRWTQAAAEADVDFSDYLREIPQEAELPWSAVSVGVSGPFLAGERRRSRAGEITADCRGGACADCGACEGDVQLLLRNNGPVPDHAAGQQETAAAGARAPVLYHYRFTYAKGAPVRFLGHLDMVAVILRAMVASGYELSYSQGYQPHPRVSFGPPLACGVAGEAEAFDVTAVARLGGDPLRMNAMLPPGLSVTAVSQMTGREDSLSSSIRAGWYAMTCFEPLAPADIDGRIAALLEKQEIPVTVEKEGKTRVKDIRPLIKSLRRSGENAIETILSLEPSATCKPAELLSALFPELTFADFLVVRKECIL